MQSILTKQSSITSGLYERLPRLASLWLAMTAAKAGGVCERLLRVLRDQSNDDGEREERSVVRDCRALLRKTRGDGSRQIPSLA